MLGLKDSRDSDDNRSTRSKQHSYDGVEHDSEPLALRWGLSPVWPVCRDVILGEIWLFANH